MFNQSLRLLIVSMLAFLPLMGEEARSQAGNPTFDYQLFNLQPYLTCNKCRKKSHVHRKKIVKRCEKGPKGATGPIGPRGPTGPGPLLAYASFESIESQTIAFNDLVTFQTTLLNNGAIGSVTGTTIIPGVIVTNGQIFKIQVPGDYSIDFGVTATLPDGASVGFVSIFRNTEPLTSLLIAPAVIGAITSASSSILVASLEAGDEISVRVAGPSANGVNLVAVNSTQSAYLKLERTGP